MPVTSRGVLLAVATAVVGSVLGTSDAAARPPQPCAADYNSTKPCCGQDPHEKNPVPVAYRCPASSPVCRCYIYGTHFGFCAKAASKSTPCPAPPPPPAPATPPPPPCQSSGKAVDVEWLSCRSEQIIKGCVESILPTSPLNKGVNGKPACAGCRRAPPIVSSNVPAYFSCTWRCAATFAYTPDATHSYGAQWTRDFQYTVSGASELMDEASVKASVRYTFAGMRADGCMPDRVQIDGMSVMAPGKLALVNIACRSCKFPLVSMAIATPNVHR